MRFLAKYHGDMESDNSVGVSGFLLSCPEISIRMNGYYGRAGYGSDWYSDLGKIEPLPWPMLLPMHVAGYKEARGKEQESRTHSCEGFSQMIKAHFLRAVQKSTFGGFCFPLRC